MNYKEKSIFKELYYQPYKKNTIKLCDYAKDNINFVQRLGLIHTLPIHDGCVNTLSWNESGSLLLSGSDDQCLVITNGHTYKICDKFYTSHKANIFSAKFLPASADRNIVSCSGDGTILLTNLEHPKNCQFNCHSGTTYEVITIPNDPNTFLSCGEDGTVRWFDLRAKRSCLKSHCKEDILLLHHRAVTALGINPMSPHELAMGSSDSTVRIFDRRMLSTPASGSTRSPVRRPVLSFSVPELEERTYRITSLSYSPDGQEMLVSYSSEHLYLFRIKDHAKKELMKDCSTKSNWNKLKSATKRARRSPPPVRRLRLRGDWSDTGPDARPERDTTNTANIGQARPQLQTTLMERMTNVLFRMLNDPVTRAALSGGGEDLLETNSSSDHSHEQAQENSQQPETHDDSLEQHDTSNEEHNITDNSQVFSQSSQESDDQSEPQASTSSNHTNNANEVSPNLQCNTTETLPHNRSEFSNLRDELSTLRHGFIEKHGSEPAFCLRYSDQSSSSSTIRVGVGDELNRSNINNYPVCDSSSAAPVRNSTNVNASSSFDQNKPSTSSAAAHNPPVVENERELSDREKEEEFFRKASKLLDRSSDELEYSDSDDEKESSLKAKIYRPSSSYNFEPRVKQKYVGHRNARTMIKEASFWGNDYVMSGSDCGHVFVWDRHTSRLVMLLQADHHVVNCLQPHPTLPLLATSGIDHDVKLWAPVLEENTFDMKMAEDLMKRNEVMLEETRDTITVPAAFMIRMLACLNQIRRTGTLLSRPIRRQHPPAEPNQKTRRNAQ